MEAEGSNVTIFSQRPHYRFVETVCRIVAILGTVLSYSSTRNCRMVRSLTSDLIHLSQWWTVRWANGARGVCAITDAEVALRDAVGWSRSRRRTAASTVLAWTKSGRAAASRHARLGFVRSRMLRVSVDRSRNGRKFIAANSSYFDFKRGIPETKRIKSRGWMPGRSIKFFIISRWLDERRLSRLHATILKPKILSRKLCAGPKDISNSRLLLSRISPIFGISRNFLRIFLLQGIFRLWWIAREFRLRSLFTRDAEFLTAAACFLILGDFLSFAAGVTLLALFPGDGNSTDVRIKDRIVDKR